MMHLANKPWQGSVLAGKESHHENASCCKYGFAAIQSYTSSGYVVAILHSRNDQKEEL